MSHLRECYSELLSLTQLFLLREHSLKQVVTMDIQHHKFFQKYSKTNYTPAKKEFVHFENPILPSARAPLEIPEPLIPSVTDSNPIQTPPAVASLPTTAREVAKPEPVYPKHLPSVVQEPVKKQMHTPQTFQLDPLPSPAPHHSLEEFWVLFSKIFPQIKLHEHPPQDLTAQKFKNKWKSELETPPVILLAFDHEESHLSFLKNVAQAISLRLAPARVVSAAKIEKDNKWEDLLSSGQVKLVIASDYGLYAKKELMKYYRENPQQGKHFLNDIPLLLLSDLALYLKQPQFKSLLWRAICNEFAASHPNLSAIR